MQEQLAAIAERFERVQGRLHDLVADTPIERWGVRADPARWSVAECVAHLNLTAQAYLPMLRDAFSDAQFAKVPAPRRYRRDLIGWLLSASMAPKRWVGVLGKSKTIPVFVPGGDLQQSTTVAEFDRLHVQLIQLTLSAEGLPLQAMRIVSPFNARLSYNAYSCLMILPRHDERHLWQAEHVWDKH
ncbi:MAG TPA: DinB family protein [Gemmatimonadaceae bacterium]|nr:DinB family protein [Gemmatimonadaceae bacterium]